MKQKAIYVSHEHKPFWQLSRLGDFAVSRNANLFVREKHVSHTQDEPF